jgi:hypothetical protein
MERRHVILRSMVLVTAWLLASLGSSGFVAAAPHDLVGLYLTLSRDPTTAVTINWVNLYPKDSNTVVYREAGASDWASGEAKQLVVEPSSLQRRFLELTGLKPDTVYEFAIGGPPEKPTEGWTLRTMPAELSRPVRFVTGGDMMHSRQMLDAMSARLAEVDPDFVLLGGDLAYEDGRAATRVADWLQSWKSFGVGKGRRLIPIVAAIGNHEVRGGYGGRPVDDAPYFYRLFVQPREHAYHALDFGKYLSLLVLDSGHTNPVPGPQAEWLAGTLAERADRTFLFACYHYPAYGTDKAARGGLPIDAPRAVAIREHWVPLFDRFGVSAVFENDHHNFKRTHPLRGHRRDDDNGILYLGDGAWGVRTRSVPKPEVAWWLAKAEPRNHFWIVDLRPDRTATVRAMDPAGTVFDEVRLPAARTRPTP